MPARRFDGSNDELRTSTGSGNLTGNLSVVTFVRPESAAEGTHISLRDSGATERAVFGHNASKQPRMGIGGTYASGGEIGYTPSTGAWGIWGYSKESGTKAPRWHHWKATEDTWSHANDSTTMGNPVSQAGGSIRYGAGSMGFCKVDFAASSLFTRVLSDAEFEELAAAAYLIDWLELEPVTLHLFKQSSVSEEVKDETGNGANQTARTETTVLEEEPPIPYESSATVHEAKASLSGAGALSGAGLRITFGKGSMSGTGTLAAKAISTRLAKASMSGTGTLAGKGTRIVPASAALSGTGSLSGKAVSTRFVKASMSGSGQLTSTATLIRQAKANLTGTGALIASAEADNKGGLPKQPFGRRYKHFTPEG